MLQLSKIFKSREEWRNKAVVRGEQNREDRKKIKHYRSQIKDLKKTIKQLKEQTPQEQLKKK